MSNNLDNWCVDIYRGLFIDQLNDNYVKIAPCCQAIPRIESLNTFDFNNSNFLQSLRTQFESGEKPRVCYRCWTDENLGRPSRRINISSAQQPSATVQLENITCHSTWACNLACIMCNANHSSSWAKELNVNPAALETYGRKVTRSKMFLESLDLSKIKRVHFNGGEPLLNNDHVTILEKLNSVGVLNSTALSYNTNGTQYPTDKTLELWKQAQLVILWFSIDATQSAFEYVRYPADWQATQENLMAIKNNMPLNVKFGFNVTVGCYNIFEIVDVLQWCNQNFPGSDFAWQIAFNFDPKMLNSSAKNAATALLKNYPEFEQLINHLVPAVDQGHNHWIDQLDVIDQRRGTNWRRALKVSEFY